MAKSFKDTTKLTQEEIIWIDLHTLKKKSWLSNFEKHKYQAQRVSPVSSTKHLRKKWYQFVKILFRKLEAEGILLNPSYEPNNTITPKADKDKPQINNSHEYLCKNLPQGISKFHPILYNKLYSWSSGIYSRYEKLVQYSKPINIIQDIERLKKKIWMMRSINAENSFDKIQHSFMLKLPENWE